MRDGDPCNCSSAVRYNCCVVHTQQPIEILRLLAARLERLSVDSHWARRAAGLRGDILKILQESDDGTPTEADRLAPLVAHAFEILNHAAHDIPDSEDHKKGANP